MDNFKRIPERVQAQNNAYNSPLELQDSQGTTHMVPAGWWLVEFSGGRVDYASDETFRAQYEADAPLTTLDSFVNTVADLRDSDRMAVQRAQELEARVASLEHLLGDIAAIVEAVVGLQARMLRLESVASSVVEALGVAQPSRSTVEGSGVLKNAQGSNVPEDPSAGPFPLRKTT